MASDNGYLLEASTAPDLTDPAVLATPNGTATVLTVFGPTRTRPITCAPRRSGRGPSTRRPCRAHLGGPRQRRGLRGRLHQRHRELDALPLRRRRLLAGGPGLPRRPRRRRTSRDLFERHAQPGGVGVDGAGPSVNTTTTSAQALNWNWRRFRRAWARRPWPAPAAGSPSSAPCSAPAPRRGRRDARQPEDALPPRGLGLRGGHHHPLLDHLQPCRAPNLRPTPPTPSG